VRTAAASHPKHDSPSGAGLPMAADQTGWGDGSVATLYVRHGARVFHHGCCCVSVLVRVCCRRACVEGACVEGACELFERTCLFRYERFRIGRCLICLRQTRK
jgi:hypothetical protein